MTYDNEFFGIPKEDTRFNLAAAVDAYEWVMKHPEESRFVLSKALYDHVPADITRNRGKVDAAANAFISKRLEEAKRGVSRTYIAKRDSGQDTTSSEILVKTIDTISKAYDTAGSYTPWERAANVRRQQRDKQGRFIVMADKIQPDVLRQTIPAATANAAPLGIPNVRMNDETRRKFQNDYMQVKEMLNRVPDSDRAGAMVRGVYTGGDDFELTFPDALAAINDPASNANGMVTQRDYRNGLRLEELEVVKPGGGTANFNALAAMTHPRFAEMVGGGLGVAGNFTEDWTKNGADDYRTDDQFWRRMGAASQLAAVVGAPVLPPAATMALQAGKWVGDLAPEAEKVIGPSARKAAYRYRGVEKKPNPIYQDTINRLREKHRNLNNPRPGKDAHDELIQGTVNPKTKEKIESPLITEFKKLLTNPQRYHLNRQAGVIPPSQGIIIDRKGQVITEAVGYGEDWYLPFNLKNLGKLDGGEYIRTRAYGGPTTEDIYVGLVSGARAVTVVSHSGVFTVEFDDTFRGSRRYNDKAGRMQDRYGHLLDAVKSKKIRLGQIPPDRMEEIKEEAEFGDGGFSPVTARRDYEERVRALVAEEKESPRLSQAATDNTIRSLLNMHVAESGKAATWDDFVTQQAVAGNSALYNKIATDDLMAAATAMGLGREASKAVADATAVYREELEPLDINGKGYYQALMGLTDQFPYYFGNIYFDGGVAAKDMGYVKPKYIRPEGALSGYFDPTITGKGKITADRTNYQNYSVERSRTPSPNEFITDASDENDLTPTGARRSRGGTSDNAKLDLLIDQIKALRDQRVFNTRTDLQDEDGVPVGGRPITDAYRQMFADDYGWDFLTDDMDEIERKIYASGLNGGEYQRLRAKVDEAFDDDLKVFPITRDAVRSEAEKDILGAPPKDAMNAILSFGDIANGQKYNWNDLNEDQDSDYYTSKITNWMRSAPAFDAVDPNNADELADAMLARGDELKRELRATNAGTGRMTEDQIANEALAMAKIVQAAKMRENAPGGHRRTPPRPTRLKPVADDPFADASEEEAYEAPEVEDSETVKKEKRIAQHQEEIRQMVGMKSVSKEVDDLVDLARLDQWREENGVPVNKNKSRHLIFIGNPGTGKTTIARQLAPIYHDLGIIEKPEVATLKAGELAGEFSNQVDSHANKILNENKGKIIFIDEAYSLLDDANGAEVYNTLLQWAEDNRDSSVIVLAGYPNQMSGFMRANPGMASRFPTTIHFPNYSSKDLKEITGKWTKDSMMTVEPKAQVSLNIALGKLVNEPDYANVRSARNLMEKVDRAHANRIARMPEATREDRLTYTQEDIKNGVLLNKQAQMVDSAKRAKRKVAAGVA